MPVSLTDDQRAFAERQRIGHLATADLSGVPHVVPVCFAIVGDLFYFVIDEKPKRDPHRLRRLRNIVENPSVALVLDQYDEDWTRLAFLLVHGHAELVTDRNEYGKGLERLRHRYPQYVNMDLYFEQHEMIRITPDRHHFWRAAVP